MRYVLKALASLAAVPLSLAVVAFGVVIVNGGTNDGLGPGDTAPLGMVSLMLCFAWLFAIWLPGIERRWLAALGGSFVVILVSVIFREIGDAIVLYQPAIAGGFHAIGPLLAIFSAIYLMRRPLFSR